VYPGFVDTTRYATDKIDDAIASGDLTPRVGVGKPIKNLTRDPDWWVRAFLDREQYRDRFAEMTAHRDEVVADAVQAQDLAEAREMIAGLNVNLRRWNAKAPPELSFDPVSEIWLVTQRAKAPGHGGRAQR